MGINLSSGYGAGAAADSLEGLLKREFLKQIEARQAREGQQQHAIQLSQLGQGQQRIDQGAKEFGQTLDFNRDKEAEGTRQFGITSGQAGERIGMEKELQPVRIKQMTAQTEDLNRQPQEAIDARTFTTERDKTQHGYQLGEIDATTAGQMRVAGVRAAATGNNTDNNLAMKLADDYTRDAKDFTTMNTAMRRVNASANNPSAAGDMALLYSYMKILDPNSVVRESEFAQAAQSGSLPQQVQGAAAKIISGQRLTPEQRADFVNRASALYGEAEKANKSVRQSYTERAGKFGVDPSLVFTDIGEPGTVGGGPVAMVAPDGRALSVPPEKVEEMLRAGAKKR